MTALEHPLVEALYRVEGKVEIVNGKIVPLPMPGRKPARAAERIHRLLWDYVEQLQRGQACAGGSDYLVNLPHRQSFRPDVSYYVGPDPDMEFFDGAPLLAVEVRSKDDYGPAAEREMAAKRADYCAAGTLVVWDVDLLSEDVARVFRDGESDESSAVFRRGETADAEPAVPGWTFTVDELFRPFQV